MKTMGGLDEYPTFKEISLSYTFDSAWTLLSAHIEEVYSVRLGIIRSDGCRAVTDCVYTYGSADLSDYFGYFADYVTK